MKLNLYKFHIKKKKSKLAEISSKPMTTKPVLLVD